MKGVLTKRGKLEHHLEPFLKLIY